MSLERPGTVALGREWLVLEAQVPRSWSQEARTRSQETRTRSSALTAQTRQGRGHRGGVRRSARLADLLAPHASYWR